MGILADLGLYLWRLVPGNPILVRVVAAGGKRVRHLWARVVYLAALLVVMLSLGGGLFSADSSLAELAKDSASLFFAISLVQLLLTSFIAPVFAAGAITQERDGNTFDILLTTPLTNGQIVFGTLLSRLFFVWVLLLSGLPILGISMIYGGTTRVEVFESLGLAATTALITGATAIMISVFRVGTRKTIFAFFFGIALYLLIGLALGLGWTGAQLTEGDPSQSEWLNEARISWVAPFHPFLALFAVTGQTPPPDPRDVQHYGWPWAPLISAPAYGYMTLTTLVSLLMIAISVLTVRRRKRESDRTLLSRLATSLRIRAADAPRVPRRVWTNPIAWREAETRGSSGAQSLLRWLAISAGIFLAGVLTLDYHQDWGLLNLTTPADLRSILTILVWIEFTIILLVVTNTAAGTLTREKESQTVEILLTTPLTSSYILGGMLQGLVRFAVPLVAIPTLTLLIALLADLIFSRHAEHAISAEAVLLSPLLMLAVVSVAAVIGLQSSLMARRTVQAVMVSTSIVLGGSLVLWGCGTALGTSGHGFASVVLPLTPFPAIQLLIDPASAFRDPTAINASTLTSVRLTRAIMSVISIALFAMLAFALYRNIVTSFDRVVRDQAR